MTEDYHCTSVSHLSGSSVFKYLIVRVALSQCHPHTFPSIPVENIYAIKCLTAGVVCMIGDTGPKLVLSILTLRKEVVCEPEWA